MISSKSCCFQAIFRENSNFEQILVQGPPWGQNSAAPPLTKILDPRLGPVFFLDKRRSLGFKFIFLLLCWFGLQIVMCAATHWNWFLRTKFVFCAKGIINHCCPTSVAPEIISTEQLILCCIKFQGCCQPLNWGVKSFYQWWMISEKSCSFIFQQFITSKKKEL